MRGESSARPAGRAAAIEPSTRLERVSNRVGRRHWREEENEHPAQPPGPDHARVVGSSGARRATIRARALTSRVTANVPRAFRADRVGVPRVPPGWVTARRLNGLYLRPHERYLRWRDELSSVASLAFRVYFLTDRHARLMANCVKTRQILTEEPCTAVGFSFSTRGCDEDFENEFQRLASGSAPPSRFTSPRAQVADPHAANPTPRAYHTAPQLEPGARAPATRAAVGQASADLATPSP